MDLRKELIAKTDKNNRDFVAKFVPGVDKNSILGTKIPVLRKIAKEILKEQKTIDFSLLKHDFREEILIHGMLLGLYKFNNAQEFCIEIERFLPFINSWEVCDCTVDSLKSILQYPDFFYNKCLEWLNSPQPFTIRFAIVVLLDYFLDDNFKEEILQILADIQVENYYINIAISWFFCEALIKQYESTIKIFEQKKIRNPWVHNKALQKSRESFRITKEEKVYLQTLKITN